MMFFRNIGTKAQRDLAVTEALEENVAIKDLLMIIFRYVENDNAETLFAKRVDQIKQRRLLVFMREDESGIMRSLILSNELGKKIIEEGNASKDTKNKKEEQQQFYVFQRLR